MFCNQIIHTAIYSEQPDSPDNAISGENFQGPMACTTKTLSQSEVLTNEMSDQMLARAMQEEEKWELERQQEKEKVEFQRLQVLTFEQLYRSMKMLIQCNFSRYNNTNIF